jgi:hypothetical protein
LGVSSAVVGKFSTAGPPDYSSALRDYIAQVYPFDGARPVYLGYDLQVRFVEDYVPYLYASVGEQLVFRLFDAQGQPVLDANGQPALVPATTVGPTSDSTTQQLWEEIYQEETERGCVQGPPVRHDSANTLTAAVSGWKLAPNSAYTAWITRDADPSVPLHNWNFVTSRYALFTDLVTLDRTIGKQVVNAALNAADFDTLARAAGLPTVGYVQHATLTALTDAAQANLVGLLIESPEPLEAPVRLSARVGSADATLVPNLDSTRVFLLPAGGTWPAITTLELTWKRDVGDTAPRLAVGGDTTDEVVTIDIKLPELP